MTQAQKELIFEEITHLIKKTLREYDSLSAMTISGLNSDVSASGRTPFQPIVVTTEKALAEDKLTYYLPSSALLLDFDEDSFTAPVIEPPAKRQPGRPKGCTKAKAAADARSIAHIRSARNFTASPLVPKWILLMNTFRVFKHAYYEINIGDQVIVESDWKRGTSYVCQCIDEFRLGHHIFPLLQVICSEHLSIRDISEDAKQRKAERRAAKRATCGAA